MNTVSWLIYAAEASGSLRTSTGILFGGGSLVALVVGVIRHVVWADNEGYKFTEKYPKPEFPFRLLLVFASLFIVTRVIPSQQTIHMIAASELGERVVTTPEAKEIMDALRVKLKDMLKVEAK